MCHALTHQDWLRTVPQLGSSPEPRLQRFLSSAQFIKYHSGEHVFRDDDPCARFLLVLSGAVRVQKVTRSGHEIVLYHLGPGQACELTTTCLIGGKAYPAEAVADNDTCVASWPREVFNDVLAHSGDFRQFVFPYLQKGVTELITLIEDVAFGHMDVRLAHCLLLMAGTRDSVDATHHDLAAELGTAREVVSRLLKEFERHSWVKLRRGHIDIINKAALRELTEKHAE